MILLSRFSVYRLRKRSAIQTSQPENGMHSLFRIYMISFDHWVRKSPSLMRNWSVDWSIG